MSIERRQIVVHGLTIQIVRKAIKNLHLGVYPPNGRVRVAAPFRVSDNAVRLAVISKLGWIKRRRAGFENQSRESKREMVTGESHYFLGRRCRLHVIPRAGRSGNLVLNKSTVELHVAPGATAEEREHLLYCWYRCELKALVPALMEKWQRRLGVRVAEWRVRKMKTMWGSCNARARRIWLNLELAKKPVPCLEYIIVHELVHLLERHHSDRFTGLMDKYLPLWRLRRKELNSAPLAQETWRY